MSPPSLGDSSLVESYAYYIAFWFQLCINPAVHLPSSYTSQGKWNRNYTGPQSFINMFSHSLATKLICAEFNFFYQLLGIVIVIFLDKHMNSSVNISIAFAHLVYILFYKYVCLLCSFIKKISIYFFDILYLF